MQEQNVKSTFTMHVLSSKTKLCCCEYLFKWFTWIRNQSSICVLENRDFRFLFHSLLPSLYQIHFPTSSQVVKLFCDLFNWSLWAWNWFWHPQKMYRDRERVCLRVREFDFLRDDRRWQMLFHICVRDRCSISQRTGHSAEHCVWRFLSSLQHTNINTRM